MDELDLDGSTMPTDSYTENTTVGSHNHEGREKRLPVILRDRV
jgi:hypothetical protein